MADDHGETGGVGGGPEVAGEGGFADPGFPADDHELAVPRGRGGKVIPQEAPLRLAAGEHRVGMCAVTAR